MLFLFAHQAYPFISPTIAFTGHKELTLTTSTANTNLVPKFGRALVVRRNGRLAPTYNTWISGRLS